MQISTSHKLITNSTLVSKADSFNGNKTSEVNEEDKIVDSYNTTSKLYFKLSDDISKYQIGNINQNKIDKDVMSIYNKYTDKGSFTDFIKMNVDINPIYSLYGKDNPFRSDEFSIYMRENEKILKSTNPTSNLNKMSIDENNQNLKELKITNEVIQSFQQKIENYFKRDTGYGISANFTYYSDEELEDISKANFKNLYSLSDDFTKTEKFGELYNQWQNILTEKKEEGNKLGKNFIEHIYNNDLSELEKTYIINKAHSKSEWVESIDKSKTILKDLLKDNPKMKESIKVDIKNNIKFYENILTDLTDLWKHGDFETKG